VTLAIVMTVKHSYQAVPPLSCWDRAVSGGHAVVHMLTPRHVSAPGAQAG